MKNNQIESIKRFFQNGKFHETKELQQKTYREITSFLGENNFEINDDKNYLHCEEIILTFDSNCKISSDGYELYQTSSEAVYTVIFTLSDIINITSFYGNIAKVNNEVKFIGTANEFPIEIQNIIREILEILLKVGWQYTDYKTLFTKSTWFNENFPMIKYVPFEYELIFGGLDIYNAFGT